MKTLTYPLADQCLAKYADPSSEPPNPWLNNTIGEGDLFEGR
ncbi:MAG: hypothetical protein ACLQPD_14820 [Desulfomonilaceae bacterium]